MYQYYKRTNISEMNSFWLWGITMLLMANQVDLDDEVKSYEVGRHSLFFSDSDCKRMYKEHVATIVNRQNSFNG